MSSMTYRAVRPVRVYTMNALYGLHGAECTCRRHFSGTEPCRMHGLSGPITSYLFSETEAAKGLAKDYATACLVTGVGAGIAAGVLGSVLKSPWLGAAAGALTGFLVFQTQRPPAP